MFAKILKASLMMLFLILILYGGAFLFFLSRPFWIEPEALQQQRPTALLGAPSFNFSAKGFVAWQRTEGFIDQIVEQRIDQTIKTANILTFDGQHYFRKEARWDVKAWRYCAMIWPYQEAICWGES